MDSDDSRQSQDDIQDAQTGQAMQDLEREGGRHPPVHCVRPLTQSIRATSGPTRHPGRRHPATGHSRHTGQGGAKAVGQQAPPTTAWEAPREPPPTTRQTPQPTLLHRGDAGLPRNAQGEAPSATRKTKGGPVPNPVPLGTPPKQTK
ncbi:hypothetical protein GE061_018582 [Apolygus lucorum]|uniref:Uncharacterized protein n=1 Tax=Apolygus lucorum TaxID=248454 RepID=A0A8S9XGB9_APOLU|nr:hypothetical protein GE061_018582 [Apolygus lucorum]